MVQLSLAARDTRVQIPVRAYFFSITKGLLNCSGFELLLSHGVVGLRVLNLLLSPTPSPIDSALPCAHGPSRAASLVLCERSERADNRLDKFSRINERSFDISDDFV